MLEHLQGSPLQSQKDNFQRIFRAIISDPLHESHIFRDLMNCIEPRREWKKISHIVKHHQRLYVTGNCCQRKPSQFSHDTVTPHNIGLKGAYFRA